MEGILATRWPWRGRALFGELTELTKEVASEDIAPIVECYEKFLKETEASEQDLLDRFMDRERVADTQTMRKR